MTQPNSLENIHANCIRAHGKGLLILGASGAGKSSLSAQLIALGAVLVADDRCEIWPQQGRLMARAPKPLAGLLELRGIGIIRLPFFPTTPIAALVHLERTTQDRMPAPQKATLAGIAVDLLQFNPGPHFPSALMCYLMGQRHECEQP